MATFDELQARAQQRREMTRQLKAMVVERLALPIDADWITDDQPLIGRGLELDSVDALELVVGVESDFGVSITDDRLDVFGSINRVADFIEQQRAQEESGDGA